MLLPINGFLVLDKPEGISSAKAVAEVKRMLGCEKIGHGGTLDPLASGILPLAIGEATKAFDYVASSIKEYRFTVTFGEERATDDREGEVTARTHYLPIERDLSDALPHFTGAIMQTPPIYSALKVDGKRAYQRARAGEEIEMKPRPVEVLAISMSSHEKVEDIKQNALDLDPAVTPQAGSLKEATFTVTCGKGTYVRSLAKDIARKCNSLGYISMLRRTRVGKFTEAKAISLDKLPLFMHNPALFEAWVSLELALDDIPAIAVDLGQATSLRHGKALQVTDPDGRYVALHQGLVLALAEVAGGLLRTKRLFNINA